VLEVVDKEQHALAHQDVAQDVDGRAAPTRVFLNMEREGDGRHDRLGFAQRGQADEINPVGEPVSQPRGDLERQMRFSRAPGTDEGQQADFGSAQELGDDLQVPFAPDQWMYGNRQVVARGTGSARGSAAELGSSLEDQPVELFGLRLGLVPSPDGEPRRTV
jgi:hypothetical protein